MRKRKGVKLTGVSPEVIKRCEEWAKWAETDEGKLTIEKGALNIQKHQIEYFNSEYHSVMESRKDVPMMFRPLDASYWHDRRPPGNLEKINERIAEIEKLLELAKQLEIQKSPIKIGEQE